jgi:hypothetical protein
MNSFVGESVVPRLQAGEAVQLGDGGQHGVAEAGAGKGQ